MTISEAFSQAQFLHQSGRLAEADAIYRQILSQNPNHADAMHLLGVIAHQSGQQPKALDLINRSIMLRRDCPQFYTNQGLVLAALGRLPEAETAVRQGLKLKPEMPDALTVLSDVLRREKKLQQAIAAGQGALRLNPRHAGAATNLGNALLDMGRRNEAIAAMKLVVDIRPDFAEGFCSLGSALAENGNWPEAAEALRSAVTLRENFPQAWDLLGSVTQTLGKPAEAEAMFARAVQLQPDFEAAWNHLAKVLGDRAKWPQCIQAYQRAVAINPKNAIALNNMGIALASSQRIGEAIAAYRRALELQPDLAIAHTNLGTSYQDDGQLDLALQCINRALELKPSFPYAHSNKIFLMHFHPGFDAAAIGREAARWNELHAAPLASSIKPHENERDPDRRLRIGYVSPFFCSQAESFFVVPLLGAHDRSQVEIYAYSSVPAPDEVTSVTRGFCDGWRDTNSWDDAELARRIRADRIDILVDLVMHMGGSRLLTFARKPAPIQVAWLAYPGTTGVSAIDYRFTDPYLDPPGMFDADYSERSIRLPRTWACYSPLFDVAPRKPYEGGNIHFGSLNNPCKLSPGTIRLWSRVMSEVKNSRLILQTPTPEFEQRTRAAFAAHGIDPARLEFHPRTPRVDYLRLYDQIDIALDPQPYNGITTTCDALWMNVPVLTHIGHRAAGRAGLSILTNAGLPELVAATEDDFVKLAVELANDIPRLRKYHQTLREQFMQSPMCDAKQFARDVEAAYRQMWRRWTKH